MGIPESTSVTVALLLFIAIGIALVMTERPIYAALVLALGGALFMPLGGGFDFPVIPPLGGRTLPYLILGLGIVLLWPNKLRGIDLGRWPDLLVLVLSLLPILTALLNSDVLIWGPRAVQGLTTWDGFSRASRTFMDVGMPYMVGRILFQTSSDLRRLLVWIAGAGLIYSLFALVEIRLSPQFHYWTYGYQPVQDGRLNVRWGGYRPTIFMDNGLAVALFMMITSVTAFALGRARIRIGFFPSRVAGPYLLVILIMCKSVAAIGYGFLLAPVVALMRPRSVHCVALGLATVVILYPLLRTQGLVPTTGAVELADSISPDRAVSLLTRFDNEDRMLEHNWDRFFFGWGGFGRNRVYNERSGVDITLTDGQWMIALSSAGLAGWACFYSLLLWPVFLGLWRLPRIRGPDQGLMACLLLLVSSFALDHLLNGFFTNLPFLFSGAAVTLLRLLPREQNLASNNPPSGGRKGAKVKGGSARASLSGAILGPRHRS